MQNPSHRDNILDPHHAAVSIGIARDDYNVKIVLHFEYGYVVFDEIPTIRDGVLSFSGTAINGAGFRSDDDLGVQIYYDPPPHSLTVGQVSRTYCYDMGVRAATLAPPQLGSNYTTSLYQRAANPCPDPYGVPIDVPAPASPDQAHNVWYQAYLASTTMPNILKAVHFDTATDWNISGDDFAV